jgi:hypothetical protein
MKTQRPPKERLVSLFGERKCWTISELCETLNYAAISVKRFLKQIGYFSSFTHNSKWYTLDWIPNFNKDGLWFYEGIGFSKHGTLNKTILHFIEQSRQGLSAKQLAEKLSSPVYAVLNHIHKTGMIDRLKTQKGFIYLSIEPDKKKQQIRRLESLVAETSKPRVLTAQAAVYVLAEFIKQPEASFAELSRAVAKRQVIATPEMIARLFEEHNLKKTLT